MKNLRHFLLILVATTILSPVQSQQLPAITLWPGGAPGAKTDGGDEKVAIYEKTGDHLISNIHSPSVIPFIPPKDKATGIAVVIAPGGGHREIWIDHEGYNIARRLCDNGIAAFILKYRLANDTNSAYTVKDHSVMDMLRAIRLVRSKASEWNIDPDKVGVMGFSAGGQIASLADIYGGAGKDTDSDPVETYSSKPDFQGLFYGAWINGITVTSTSSPAFICGGYNDMESISTGMAELYLKFKKAGIQAELHIYANTGHGFGIREGDSGPSSHWPETYIIWLKSITGTK